MPDTKVKTKDRTAADDQWTDAEIAAMKEHAKEIKTAQRRKKAGENSRSAFDVITTTG